MNILSSVFQYLTCKAIFVALNSHLLFMLNTNKVGTNNKNTTVLNVVSFPD